MLNGWGLVLVVLLCFCYVLPTGWVVWSVTLVWSFVFGVLIGSGSVHFVYVGFDLMLFWSSYCSCVCTFLLRLCFIVCLLNCRYI